MTSSTLRFVRSVFRRSGRPLAGALVCGLIGVVGARADEGRIVPPAEPGALVRDALAAENAGDVRRALELFLAADRASPGQAYLLQKIARQYSDAIGGLADAAERRRFAGEALRYSEAAARLAPRDPVARLSIAISAGKLALDGDNRTKAECARRIRDEAEAALALAPDYDWAYHVLGRWHVEMAALGRARRFVAGVLYGGVPAGKLDEGIAHLRRAVALAPETVPHRIELGAALAAAGRNEEARAEFARGLVLPVRESHDAASQRRGRELLAQLPRAAE